MKLKHVNQYSGDDKWLPFEEAREIVRIDVKKYGINGWNKWQNDYVKNNNLRFNAVNTLKLGKILYHKDGLKMNRKFDLFQKAKRINI